MPKGYYKNTNQPIFKTHGMSGERFLNIWRSMKQRCTDKNSTEYKRYGERGIAVCWEDFESFYEEMYPSYKSHCIEHGEHNTTIDRIDNDKSYFKENCRWATPRQQANNRRTNHYITYQGKTQSMADWSREKNINYSLLKKRLILGWDLQKIFNTKSRKPVVAT